ncbi:hypothetical protein [Actinomadura sediminis]|uniref:Uncharacterized protein n=1 Tax=Actinomadura sediminis TaxID=1038904 RepID=A0ABW3EUA7_9ACTN
MHAAMGGREPAEIVGEFVGEFVEALGEGARPSRRGCGSPADPPAGRAR